MEQLHTNKKFSLNLFLGNQRSKEEERKIHQVNLPFGIHPHLLKHFWFWWMLTNLPILCILPLSWVLLWTCVLTNNLIPQGINSIPTANCYFALLKRNFSQFYFFLNKVFHLCLFTKALYCAYMICTQNTWIYSQDLGFQWLSIPDIPRFAFLNQVLLFQQFKLK